MRRLGGGDGRATCRPFLLAALLLGGCASAPRPWRAAWSAHAEGLNSAFGRRAMGTGDLNGDGYGDLAVGAPDFQDGRGKAYAYCGGPQGLGAKPCWSRAGDARGDHFGDRLGQAGDLNGDGVADLFVSAPSWRSGPGKLDVFYGRAGGPAAEPDWEQSPASGEREQFGDCTHPTGDVNADGYDDLLVGAYQALSSAGRAQLYLGGKGGLAHQPAWEGRGEAEGDQFGYTLSTAGDADGDGFGDVLIGAKFHDNSAELSATAKSLAAAGKSYLYYGTAKGLRAQARAMLGREAEAQHSVRGYLLGDTDGDGKPELMISEPGAEGGSGRLLIVDARSGALLKALHGRALGVKDFGRAAGPAGDVDGDGYDDLVAAGKRADQGRVWLWRGGPQGIDPGAGIPLLGASAGGGYGSWVAPAGDLDGDGLADVVVSSDWSGEAFALGGKVEVFYGKDRFKAAGAQRRSKMDVYLLRKAKK